MREREPAERSLPAQAFEGHGQALDRLARDARRARAGAIREVLLAGKCAVVGRLTAR